MLWWLNVSIIKRRLYLCLYSFPTIRSNLSLIWKNPGLKLVVNITNKCTSSTTKSFKGLLLIQLWITKKLLILQWFPGEVYTKTVDVIFGFKLISNFLVFFTQLSQFIASMFIVTISLMVIFALLTFNYWSTDIAKFDSSITVKPLPYIDPRVW